MNVKATTSIRAATALALAVWAGGAVAQQDRNVADAARPADNPASCRELNLQQDFVTSYPWASEGCRAVTTVNGVKWARFEGTFQGMNDDGSFDARFTGPSGRQLGTVTLRPAPGQMVRLDNRDVAFSDLDDGQILSFYVPENATGFAMQPGVPESQYVDVVDSADRNVADNDADDDAGFDTDDDTSDTERTELAQADTRRNADTAADRDTLADTDDDVGSELPNTAGPLPLIALGGLMSLFGGLGLTIRRKLGKRNS